MSPNNRNMSQEGPIPTESLNHAGVAISRIETIMESVIDKLSRHEPMSIALASRRSLRRRQNQTSSRQVDFPGRSAQEAQRFARILLILQLAHDAIVSGTVLTKRNIFYQHQDLFGTQRVVDELVDDIATTVGLDRDGLNVAASAKGSLVGALKIQLEDGAIIDASSGDTGIVIPAARSIQSMDLGPVQWVLVIEKDATFRSLSSTQFWDVSGCGKGLLVTARGYPDMITRAFLHLLGRERPDIPIFVLTDFDPDGLNIFHCYLYGSGNILTDSRTKNPSMIWLGIRSHHLTSMNAMLPVSIETVSSQPLSLMGNTSTDISSTTPNEAMLLTLRDHKAIVDSLARYIRRDCGSMRFLRRELQVMQMLGYKTEIQLLDDCGSLDVWLNRQIEIEMISF